MLVLLPPSETKRSGGEGPPLRLDALSFSDLNPVRQRLTCELVALAHDVPASLAALGVSKRQAHLVADNAALWTSPTSCALHRYSGVLYDAIEPATMTRAEAERAGSRIAISSALFGLLRANDPVPAYRFSAGSVLPDAGKPGPMWKAALRRVLDQQDELIVDLRSGAYAAFARPREAVSVRVVTVDGGGRRTTVSHHNKVHKGRLARALLRTRKEPASVADVVDAAAKAGITVEPTGERALDLVVGG